MDQDPELFSSWMQVSIQKRISFFMQGGIDPKNWQQQEIAYKKFPGHFGVSMGLHPYFIAQNDTSTCEIALDLLSRQVSSFKKNQPSAILALGELGLDFRKSEDPLFTNSKERQITFFENQLELVDWLQLPVVFHIVRAHPEAFQILQMWKPRNLKGLVHSFNGPIELANAWIKQGLYLSVGGPVCYEKNQKLRKCIAEMPLEYLLLETDSPDQPPPGYQKGFNPPYSLWDVAKTIGAIRNLDAEEILDISNKNFIKVFTK